MCIRDRPCSLNNKAVQTDIWLIARSVLLVEEIMHGYIKAAFLAEPIIFCYFSIPSGFEVLGGWGFNPQLLS